MSVAAYKRQQRGASFLATLFLLVIAGIILLVSLKLVPAYMDNRIIVTAIDSVREQPEMAGMNIARFRSEVMRTITVNGIRDFDTDSITYTRDGDAEYIALEYETRIPLLYNIDALLTFERRFDK